MPADATKGRVSVPRVDPARAGSVCKLLIALDFQLHAGPRPLYCRTFGSRWSSTPCSLRPGNSSFGGSAGGVAACYDSASRSSSGAGRIPRARARCTALRLPRAPSFAKILRTR